MKNFDPFQGNVTGELPEHVDPRELQFQRLKVMIHQKLVESLDFSRIDRIGREQLSRYADQLAQHICGERKELLNRLDRERLHDELLAEVYGLGPLDRFFEDASVSDILVNGPYTVYVERNGRIELTNAIFADEDHLIRIIRRVVSRVGRRIDEINPMVDARLPDGSRINAVIPPLVLDGATLSIRRFGTDTMEIDDLLALGSMIPEMAQFFEAMVRSRIGCLVSGGTGAGKTTLLNAMSHFVPEAERLITIEDSAELRLRHRHWIRMETRPGSVEDRAGEVTQRDLLRNSLRMRPDRIIVGEVRGAEVWDMLQAMNTGHDGSLTTVHANSTQEALTRLEMMVTLSGNDLPVNVIREYISSGISLIVHLARLPGGARRIVQVTEVQDLDEDKYVLRDIFGFRQTGVTEDGVALGEFYATGIIPNCVERMRSYGEDIPDSLFDKHVYPIEGQGVASYTMKKPSAISASAGPLNLSNLSDSSSVIDIVGEGNKGNDGPLDLPGI